MRLEDLAISETYTSKTPSGGFFSRLCPSVSHFLRVLGVVVRAGSKAHKKQYSAADWVESSVETVSSIEKSGVRVSIEGLQHIRALEGPCVFIGNHMSTLETFALPSIIQPFKDVTFVVKESLLNYPFFGAVLASRDPIVVGRTNPRQDLTAVLEGGKERLERGRSIIVFPQSTRSSNFDLNYFNSIGVKLARRAGVPVLPIAIKTDAWTMGRFLKDFGPVDNKKDVHFRFGPPLTIVGNGKKEHDEVCAFISAALQQWGVQTIALAAAAPLKGELEASRGE